MGMNERIYIIDQMLAERRFVTISQLLERLEVSRATLKRDLSILRDRMQAPIIFDKELGGYRYEKQDQASKFELPGLWFSAEEIHALLTTHHLLSNLDTGGLLGGHIKPLLSRLTALLGTADNSVEEIQKRVRIEMMNVRRVRLEHFEAVGSALLKRRRLRIEYYARGTNQTSQREISPQRLINYRGNWYLDGWCHLRNDLRSFSIDSIRRVELLVAKTKDISEKRLNEILGSGYGIFSGKATQWATLHFTPEISRWVSNESWHPKQKGRYLDDGCYELKIPYSKDTELLMDIMRYGAGVKVITPPSLVDHISKELNSMLAIYN